MAIQRFFDKTVVIRRLRDAGSGKRSYQATATADCAIQDIERSDRIASGFVAERAWIAWFDIEFDVQEGDHLTRADDGRTFKVVEKTIRDYGINQHIEIIMVEYNG